MIFLFLAVKTQWRMGNRGPIGLDYNVVHHLLDRKGMDQQTYDQYMDDISVIETAALAELHKED